MSDPRVDEIILYFRLAMAITDAKARAYSWLASAHGWLTRAWGAATEGAATEGTATAPAPAPATASAPAPATSSALVTASHEID